MSIFAKIMFSLVVQMAGYWAGSIAGNLNSSAAVILVHMLTVVVLTLLLRFERRWLLINAILPIAVLTGTHLTLSSASVMIIILFVLLFLPTIWTRIPYYPTHKEMYSRIAAQLPDQKNFNFLDAGCGDGALLIYLAHKFPAGHFTGVELSPISFLVAWLNALISGQGRVKIKYKSFWQINFAEFSYIYAFLSPPPMPALCKKAQQEMHAGSHLLVNSFPLPIQPASTLQLTTSRADRSGTLYIYKF